MIPPSDTRDVRYITEKLNKDYLLPDPKTYKRTPKFRCSLTGILRNSEFSSNLSSEWQESTTDSTDPHLCEITNVSNEDGYRCSFVWNLSDRLWLPSKACQENLGEAFLIWMRGKLIPESRHWSEYSLISKEEEEKLYSLSQS